MHLKSAGVAQPLPPFYRCTESRSAIEGCGDQRNAQPLYGSVCATMSLSHVEGQSPPKRPMGDAVMVGIENVTHDLLRTFTNLAHKWGAPGRR